MNSAQPQQVNRTRNAIQMLSLGVFSVALTALSLIFGAIPMRKTWLLFSSSRYWLFFAAVLATLLVLGEWPLGLMFGVLVVLVGSFGAMERYQSLFFAAVFSICTSLAVAAIGVASYSALTGFNFLQALKAELTANIEILKKAQGGLAMDYSVQEVLNVLPGVMVAVLMVSLVLSLLFEMWMPVAHLPEAERLKKRVRELKKQLISFRAPSLMVVFACAVAVGALWNHPYEWLKVISVNFGIILAVIYFFQGICVTAFFFKKLHMNPWLQGVAFLVLAMQFVFVSIVGFVDYWLDIRHRFGDRNKGPVVNS